MYVFTTLESGKVPPISGNSTMGVTVVKRLCSVVKIVTSSMMALVYSSIHLFVFNSFTWSRKSSDGAHLDTQAASVCVLHLHSPHFPGCMNFSICWKETLLRLQKLFGSATSSHWSR